MHRNAEIWEKRDTRMYEIFCRATANYRQAENGASDHDELDAIIQRREDWEKRWQRIANRVWNALCVAKGWRKA